MMAIKFDLSLVTLFTSLSSHTIEMFTGATFTLHSAVLSSTAGYPQRNRYLTKPSKEVGSTFCRDCWEVGKGDQFQLCNLIWGSIYFTTVFTCCWRDRTRNIICRQSASAWRQLLSSRTEAVTPGGKLRLTFCIWDKNWRRKEKMEVPERGHMRVTDVGWAEDIRRLQYFRAQAILGPRSWLLWVSWLEHCPVIWKVMTPSRGTFWGCGFGSQLGCVQGNWLMSMFLSHINVPPRPFPL